MDYSNWLMQPPYHWTQDEKEGKRKINQWI